MAALRNLFEWIDRPEAWIAFATLVLLEIVLGIDNIIFISILAGKLPPEQQSRARIVGLGVAMLTRIALLFSLAWLTRLTSPLFSIPLPWLSEPEAISGRDLILLIGGLFLICKATFEIHDKFEGAEEHHTERAAHSFMAVIIQIGLLDIIFSLDSVITAVGMANHLGVMVAAVVAAVLVMMLAAGSVAAFVDRHPTIKMLALSFLVLIGVALVAESFDREIPKGYIYFAMAFSVLVEMLNLRVRGTSTPVQLKEPTV